MSTNALDRRAFLRVSAAVGGGLVVALRFPNEARASASAPELDTWAPNAFVRIAPDGRTTVMINKAEMGQGVCTSLAMIVAEELDADWSKVGFEFAPVHPDYAHPGFGIQMTGGSTSVGGMGDSLRHAGATARALLVAAAAARWSVDSGECSTEAGQVVHAASGRRAGHGELANEAARLEPPGEVVLKERSAYRLLGKPIHRLDTPDKVAGKALFATDVHLEGMLVALVAHPPTFGGKPKRVDAEAAKRIAGVREVVTIPSGVAVIADGFWPAKRGRDALVIDWELGPNANVSTSKMREEYRVLARQPGLVARSDGDAQAALEGAVTMLEADYELPYLAHAPMEPLCCVVDLKPDSCEIWAGTQFQTIDQAAAAATAGLAPEQVQIHTTFLGGGFGRRANPVSDYVVEAVEIAKRAKAPIKLHWTREDDLRGGYYRPLWHSRVVGALDGRNEITAWSHTIVGQSFIAGTPFEPFIIHDGIDHTSVEGAMELPYAIPNVRVELHTTEVGVPTLWWRSVGHSHTAFVVESFLDELAHAAGEDPLALRRRLLAEHPRELGVLNSAAALAGWDAPPPAGRARGLAVHSSFGSYVAHVAEVSLDAGRLRIHRYCCAVDCGRVVNPDTIAAQMEGAIGFGLTAALYGEITLEDGRVRQSNFHDYPLLRIHEMPSVDVVIVESDEPSSGVGEPGVPPVAPALANAIFALTKKRIRRLPIRPEDLRA